MRHGQPGNPADAAYIKEFNERQRVEFPKNHPPRESTAWCPSPTWARVPTRVSKADSIPAVRMCRRPRILRPASLQPGRSGRSMARVANADAGKVVMISVGMSNTTIESQTFAKLLESQHDLNPKFQFVDCAQGGQVAIVTSRPQSKYWTVAEERLTAAGVTAKQVQVAWLKQANAAPVLSFLEEAKRLQGDLANTIKVMLDRYPNLKIVYLSSRIYAGFANVPLNPEPYAYESGFSVKWLIEDQINGKSDLKIAVAAPGGAVSLGRRQQAAQRRPHLRARRTWWATARIRRRPRATRSHTCCWIS